MPDYKLSEDVAQGQVNTLLDYYGIDLDDFEDDQKKAISQVLKKITKGIRMGHIDISNDKGITIIQHLQEPPGDVSTLEYGPVNGKSRLAMKEKSNEYERCYQLVGSITGHGSRAISNLNIKDLKYCESLGMLFLSV